MIFNSPVVRKYILNNVKLVATIRKSGYYREGQKVIMRVGDKRFCGEIIAIAPLTSWSLSNYVKFSGFKSVEEWLAEASQLHKTRIDPNKFEIVVIEILS